VSWVYIIGARDGSAVKVGRGHPIKRLRSLQVGNPEQLHVLAKQRLSNEDAKRIEGLIHGGLERFRLRGEWFQRSEEVEDFLSVFRRARKPDLEIYVARIWRRHRCDRCHMVISLTAPLDEVTRCGSCVEAARATAERLKAGLVARRDQLATQVTERGYLRLTDVSKRLRLGLSSAFLRKEAREGRLRSVRLRGSSALWFLPEWVDAWSASLRTEQQQQAEMPQGGRYLDHEGASAHFGGALLGRDYIHNEIQGGRLQAARFQGSSGWWFLPEWLDAWAESSATGGRPAQG